MIEYEWKLRMIRLLDEESPLIYWVFSGAIVGFYNGSNEEDWTSAEMEEDEEEEDEEEEDNGYSQTIIRFTRIGWVGEVVLIDERIPKPLTLVLRHEHDFTAPERRITINGITIEEQNNNIDSMRLSCDCDEGRFNLCFSRVADHCRLYSRTGETLKSFIIDENYRDYIGMKQIFCLELSILLEYILYPPD